jgi:D-alanyl-D-alanine carboxypeptidase
MNRTKKLLLGVLIGVAVLMGAQPIAAQEAPLDEIFQTMLDGLVSENEGIHNAVMLIEGQDFKWKGAAGLADPEAGVAMTTEHQYRSASIGKMFTATLAVKLAEQGVLDLDAPLADYLPDDVIAGIHVYEGTDYSYEITIRQALQHTTGVADYMFDDRDEGKFVAMVLETDTDRLWEPVELVNYVHENDYLTPYFAPGESMDYTDTNYVLVGLAIEAATGQPLHEAYREQLFEPLGMDHTYLEFREEARPSLDEASLSHVFWGEIDYTPFRSISSDWAGGGLVATVEDYNTFIRAFAHNEIFANPETRDAMLDWVDWPEAGEEGKYGLGMMYVSYEGIEFWGHAGVGQSFMFYWPDGDVTICGTLNQEEAPTAFLVTINVIATLIQAQP